MLHAAHLHPCDLKFFCIQLLATLLLLFKLRGQMKMTMHSRGSLHNTIWLLFMQHFLGNGLDLT